MRDYSGRLEQYQAKLNAHGVRFDITMLCGATKREIEGVVDALCKGATKHDKR